MQHANLDLVRSNYADRGRGDFGERVLVVHHASGRGRTTGLEVEQITSPLTEPGANLFGVQGDMVTRLVRCWDRDRALAELRMGQ